jgi:hypothetical protein
MGRKIRGLGDMKNSATPHIVDSSRGERCTTTREKHWPDLAPADQVLQITQELIINDRHNPSLVSFPRSDCNPLAFKVDVAHVELDQLLSAQAEPPERFYNAPVTKVVLSVNEFFELGWFQVIGRGLHLVFHGHFTQQGCHFTVVPNHEVIFAVCFLSVRTPRLSNNACSAVTG